jgi:quercetin dioxygenase-like cupin family protein
MRLVSGLRRPRGPLLVIAVLCVLACGAGIGWAVGSSGRAPEPVVREALAQSSHATGGKGRTLGLTRVTIQPGAEIPLHHHPGTQVSYVDEGTLTYSVESGSVKVMKGPSDDHPKLVRKIDAGTTARIRAGQWIVEQPGEHHHAANRGDVPVVIYLSTLFPKGAPPSIPG